jgi:hypothetical protein
MEKHLLETLFGWASDGVIDLMVSTFGWMGSWFTHSRPKPGQPSLPTGTGHAKKRAPRKTAGRRRRDQKGHYL